MNNAMDANDALNKSKEKTEEQNKNITSNLSKA